MEPVFTGFMEAGCRDKATHGCGLSVPVNTGSMLGYGNICTTLIQHLYFQPNHLPHELNVSDRWWNNYPHIP